MKMLGCAYVSCLLFAASCAAFEYESLQTRKDPATAEKYYLEGKNRQDDGDYWGALPFYQEAILRDRNYSEAYINLGYAYAQVGRNRDGIKVLNQAIRLGPEEARSYYYLAQIHLKQDNVARARELHQSLLTLDPKMAAQLALEIENHILSKPGES